MNLRKRGLTLSAEEKKFPGNFGDEIDNGDDDGYTINVERTRIKELE